MIEAGRLQRAWAFICGQCRESFICGRIRRSSAKVAARAAGWDDIDGDWRCPGCKGAS